MNDTAIIQAICEGGEAEHEAFLFLHNNQDYQTKAYATVKQYKSLRLTSWKDIFHESLIKLITQVKAGKYDKDKGFYKDTGLIYFFQGICNFTCLEKTRSERKEKEYPVLELPPGKIEDLETPLQIIYTKELKQLLKDALGMLKEKCQHILVLWSEQYSSNEIAEMVGLKEGASTRNSVKRCKENLRERLRNNPRLLNELTELRWI